MLSWGSCLVVKVKIYRPVDPAQSNQVSYSWFQSHTSRQVEGYVGWFVETQQPLEKQAAVRWEGEGNQLSQQGSSRGTLT